LEILPGVFFQQPKARPRHAKAADCYVHTQDFLWFSNPRLATLRRGETTVFLCCERSNYALFPRYRPVDRITQGAATWEGAAMRSKLFVPCSRPEFFAKALASDADALSFDLEDAVPDSDKVAARSRLVEWLRSDAVLSSAKRMIDDDIVRECRKQFVGLPPVEQEIDPVHEINGLKPSVGVDASFRLGKRHDAGAHGEFLSQRLGAARRQTTAENQGLR
jgi:hypothetical protein